MTLEVPEPRYSEIAEAIRSADSPVGIDATRTHVMILHKLVEIERRLERLERALAGQASGVETHRSPRR
jgi:hypothetical protein